MFLEYNVMLKPKAERVLKKKNIPEIFGVDCRDFASVHAFSDGYLVTAIFIAAGILLALLIRDSDAAATLRTRLNPRAT